MVGEKDSYTARFLGGGGVCITQALTTWSKCFVQHYDISTHNPPCMHSMMPNDGSSKNTEWDIPSFLNVYDIGVVTGLDFY